MKIIALVIVLIGCGVGIRQSGRTEHRIIAEGEAKIVHEVAINIDSIIEACEKTNNPSKCIRDLIKALTNVLDKADEDGE